jgi:hypothetical protein
MFVLLMAGNLKLKMWDVIVWHDFHTEFYKIFNFW